MGAAGGAVCAFDEGAMGIFGSSVRGRLTGSGTGGFTATFCGIGGGVPRAMAGGAAVAGGGTIFERGTVDGAPLEGET